MHICIMFGEQCGMKCTATYCNILNVSGNDDNNL